MIYVLSDIHGHRRRFDSIMRQIDLQPEDTLYVLGDVIDRKPDGLRILRELMQMPNVKMLLGNHEYMMLAALNVMKAPLSRESQHNLSLWYRNGGEVTHKHLKHLRKEVRQEIFDYLNDLPLTYEVEVNGIKYRLVHGAPEEMFYGPDGYRYLDERECAVWMRLRPLSELPEGCTVIFGHTPTSEYQEGPILHIYYGKNRIGIDCGGAYDLAVVDGVVNCGRLACLRLDDMKEFYSEENIPENPKKGEYYWIAE